MKLSNITPKSSALISLFEYAVFCLEKKMEVRFIIVDDLSLD